MPHRKRIPEVKEGILALRALILAGERLRQAVAERLGVGVPKTVVMSHLSLRGPLGPREVAERLELTPSTVTSLLDRLENAGYVCRTPHPSDRRKTVITLTEAGEDAMTVSDDWLSDVVVRLGVDIVPEVTRSMRRLEAGIYEQVADLRSSRHETSG